MMNNATANTHCKLTFNNQIRRFVFAGTEFADLRGQISQLIGLPPEGFVLKYVDNESDLINMSTTEELSLALELADKVLRIVAEPVVQQGTETGTPEVSGDMENQNPWCRYRGRGGWGGRGGRGGYRGGWHGRHGHHGGPHGFPGHPGDHPHPGPGEAPVHPGSPWGGKWGHYAEKCEEGKMRITMKLDYLKGLLAQMPPDDQSANKYKLMAQIHRLEGRILRWDAWVEKKGKKAEHKHCKKWEKHEKKHEKKLDHLSPEALQQLQLYKAQIASLKPTLFELKAAKKAKKSQLEISLQQGSGDKEAIWQEILVLKERIAEVKKEIKPLKDNIHALKEKK